jgi:hypothetical protein
MSAWWVWVLSDGAWTLDAVAVAVAALAAWVALLGAS